VPRETKLIRCSECGAEQNFQEALVGKLGRFEMFRCRHCGKDFARLEPRPKNDANAHRN
jgi:uncharacterized Zn finger protein